MVQVLVFNHDITKYPPILSIINILLETEEKVIYLGYCSNVNLRVKLEEKGLIFQQCIENNVGDNKLKKLYKLFKYKKKVFDIIAQIEGEPILWFFGNENVWMFDKLIESHKSILYLFEMPLLQVEWRYKLLNPSIDYHKAMANAWKVVCCEYNRAHITNAYFDLEKFPVVIPNKPKYDDIIFEANIDPRILESFRGKKIVLYQGIFNYPERRLDELCESIKFLPEEYVICIMGSDDINKMRLVKKYQSDRVIFLPFISAPNHLAITKLAFVGFLSYFPSKGNIGHVLNTLYCAPNKIYEYSHFGIPMISNDVPALKHQFTNFHAGIAISPFTPQEIAMSILKISESYNVYSDGATNLFESIDVPNIVKSELLNKE